MGEFELEHGDFDFGDDYCEPGSFAAPGSRVPVRGLSRPRRGLGASRGLGWRGGAVGVFWGVGPRFAVWERFLALVLVILLFAVALAMVEGLDGVDASVGAEGLEVSGSLDRVFGGGGFWGSSSQSVGVAASSRASCPSGYSLSSDSSSCEKVESRAAALSCPAGSSRFSSGVAPVWGCRRDLGVASTSYSCAQGVLVTVSNGFQGGRACKITSSSTESQAASASCSPRGTPSSCRYTVQVTTRQSQGASASCSPRGTPSSCRYTTRVSTRQSQGASRYCSPRGTPTACRYSVRESTAASYRYVAGGVVYYYCSPGWSRSGRTCYRYVTRYGSLRYSCPSGWSRSGSSCYRYVTTTVTRYGTLSYSCPSGWSRSGSSCYRNVTTTVTRYGTLSYSCSPGWSRSGSVCSRTTTSVRYVSPASSRSCSSGILASGRCWLYPAKVKSCLSGWTLTGSTCRRTLTAAVTYTYSCPQGRTLRGTRCYTPTTTTTTAASTTTTVATTTTTLAACPVGEFRVDVSVGCVSVPASLVVSSSSSSGGLASHPGVGSVTLVWRLARDLPASYKVRWKEASEVSYPSAGAGVRSFKASAAEVALPPPLSSGEALYVYKITGLKTCTVYDFKLQGYTSAGVLSFTREVKDTPKGTPSAVRDARLVVMSQSGAEVRVFWQKPACDGGSPLTGYTVRWKYEDASTWETGDVDLPVDVNSDGNADEYFSRMIEAMETKEIEEAEETSEESSTEVVPTEIIDGTEVLRPTTPKSRDVEVLARNALGVSQAVSFSGAPVEFSEDVEPLVDAGKWRPYALPQDAGAWLHEKLRRGETVSICTRVGDFAAGLEAAERKWNAVLSGALRVEVLGASSVKVCGEKTATEEENEADQREKSASTLFDVVLMDYRSVCAAPASPPLLVGVASGCCPPTLSKSGDCDDSSCASPRRSAAASSSCGFASSTPTCSKVGAGGCALVKAVAGDYKPDLIRGSVIHITKNVPAAELERYIVHELGHFLGLGDYGQGCRRITLNDTTKSVMSYGLQELDWRDWDRRVLTQDPEAVECETSTPSARDKADLQAIYIPDAFRNPAFERVGTTGDQWELKFGLPPQDNNQTKTYNAYRYVVFYRTGSTGTLQLLKNNAGKASLTTGNPITLTPAQIEKPVVADPVPPGSSNSDGSQTNDESNDWGVLVNYIAGDATSELVFKLNLTFDVGEISSLRGKEFVIAGVTRAPFVESSASARPRVNLNLFEEDPALEEWRVGELAIAKIPALP